MVTSCKVNMKSYNNSERNCVPAPVSSLIYIKRESAGATKGVSKRAIKLCKHDILDSKCKRQSDMASLGGSVDFKEYLPFSAWTPW